MNIVEHNEFNIALMNQVNEIINNTFTNYRCNDYDYIAYYPQGKNRYKIKIELHYDLAEVKNCRLVLKYRTNPENSWIQTKFNYSVKSLSNLLMMFEYLNIGLHRDNSK